MARKDSSWIPSSGSSSDLGFKIQQRRPDLNSSVASGGYDMWPHDYVNYVLDADNCEITSKTDDPSKGPGKGPTGKNPCDLVAIENHAVLYNTHDPDMLTKYDLDKWGYPVDTPSSIMYDKDWGNLHRAKGDKADAFDTARRQWRKAIDGWNDLKDAMNQFHGDWNAYVQYLTQQKGNAAVTHMLLDMLVGGLAPELYPLILAGVLTSAELQMWEDNADNILNLMTRLGSFDRAQNFFSALIAIDYADMTDSFMDLWREQTGDDSTSKNNPCGSEGKNSAIQSFRQNALSDLTKFFPPPPGKKPKDDKIY